MGFVIAQRFRSNAEKEHNFIVFDDLIATDATMISVKNLLEPLGKNYVSFTDINNKL